MVRHLPYPLLLESSGPLGDHSRYSYLMAGPRQVVALPPAPDAFDGLRSAMSNPSASAIPGLPPFQGGLAGYLSYELGASLEQVRPAADDAAARLGVLMGVYDWVVAWDRVSDDCWLIDHRGNDRQASELARVIAAAPPPALPAPVGKPAAPRHELPPSTFTRSDYEAAVQRIRDYILDGDVYQVNLTQRFLLPSTRDLTALYQRLQERSPAPFSACFDAADHQVLSISPELFLSLDAGRVETRPIKGTRPRGKTPGEDASLARELVASAKDRAENVMIVDLLRNDLSRVAQPGSVVVPQLCALETHPTVHHLVSSVEASLRPAHDAIDLVRATLPGGSITGAPKVRAMQIIRELEPASRGVYCGAIGYIGWQGQLKLSVAIRTLTRRQGMAEIAAGGGVVLGSDPAAEYDESVAKARALLDAADE